MRYRIIIAPVIGIATLLCLFTAIRSGETGVKVLSGNTSGISVTIDAPGHSPIAEADSLKDVFKLKEAIDLYKIVSADKI